MEAEILHRDDRAAPRYISNPTAPYLTNAACYHAWPEALDPTLQLSLHFHISFCDSLCWIFDCTTMVVPRCEHVAKHLQRLRNQVEIVARILAERRCAYRSPGIREATSPRRLHCL
ncbi:MAG: hypothetical protein O3B21_12910 [Proteobacteria bacterium]|nr:hypothetical protein [Pseudomonadota bacterium]MDA1356606.1 hypothetical protein [Pseudomonadota bacterium]